MADGIALRLNRDPVTLLPEYTAQDERLLAGLSLTADGTGGLMTREGKRLGAGLEVTVSGDGLNAVVAPGLAVVNHALATGGDYHVAIPAQVTKALGAKPAPGLKRRDAVVVDVSDEDVAQKATSLREANIGFVTGAETSGTPTTPAAGTMQFTIGVVAFDGANTPFIFPTNPRYTWAAGGIGVVFSQAERDALPAYNGMKVYREDLNTFQQRRNGAWEDEGVVTGDWIDYAILSGTGFSENGTRVRVVGNRVTFDLSVQRSGGTIASGSAVDLHLFTLEPQHRPGNNPEETGSVMSFAAINGTVGGICAINIGTGSGEVRLTYTTNQILTGHRLRGTFHYFTD